MMCCPVWSSDLVYLKEQDEMMNQTAAVNGRLAQFFSSLYKERIGEGVICMINFPSSVT